MALQKKGSSVFLYLSSGIVAFVFQRQGCILESMYRYAQPGPGAGTRVPGTGTIVWKAQYLVPGSVQAYGRQTLRAIHFILRITNNLKK